MRPTPFFVGLDVGATSMKAGVVDDMGRPLSNVSLATEAYRGQQFGLERMCATIRLAIRRAGLPIAKIKAIGVATPGTMDIPAGIILDPPNLRPWQNVAVRQYIQEAFQRPTAFQNDANAATLGEYWVGAGRGSHSMVLFTLGTGVGGGIVIGGTVLEGRHSHGAELGHQRIQLSQARQCSCGRWGCLEAYASATAVVKRTSEALADKRNRSVLSDILKSKGELTAKDIFRAASKDKLARQIVDETAFYLAVGAVNMMHIIDPDMVGFGGGMTAAGQGFLQRIRQHIKELAFPVPAARTEVRYALLGTNAGFIGAAACGRQLLNRVSTDRRPVEKERQEV